MYDIRFEMRSYINIYYIFNEIRNCCCASLPSCLLFLRLCLGLDLHCWISSSAQHATTHLWIKNWSSIRSCSKKHAWKKVKIGLVHSQGYNHCRYLNDGSFRTNPRFCLWPSIRPLGSWYVLHFSWVNILINRHHSRRSSTNLHSKQMGIIDDGRPNLGPTEHFSLLLLLCANIL